MSPHFLFHKYGFNHFCPLLERQSNIFDFASRNTCNVAIRPSAVINLFQFFLVSIVVFNLVYNDKKQNNCISQTLYNHFIATNYSK